MFVDSGTGTSTVIFWQFKEEALQLEVTITLPHPSSLKKDAPRGQTNSDKQTDFAASRLYQPWDRFRKWQARKAML